MRDDEPIEIRISRRPLTLEEVAELMVLDQERGVRSERLEQLHREKVREQLRVILGGRD